MLKLVNGMEKRDISEFVTILKSRVDGIATRMAQQFQKLGYIQNAPIKPKEEL
jgi:hypothetical protein